MCFSPILLALGMHTASFIWEFNVAVKRACSIDCRIGVKDLVCISQAVAPGSDRQLVARNRAISPAVTAREALQ